MKRTFDIIISIILLVLLSIPILIIALLVKITSTGPVLFWSDRIGKNNMPFKMPKFRTMNLNTPIVATSEIDNAEKYLTPMGDFLRKNSLDELPQLFSIIMGKMSLVGPRPALFNQDDLIKSRKKIGAENILPGLTGWAQVNGRDNLSITEKVALDAEYCRCQSFLFDLKIIWMTFLKVFKREGISH